MDECFLWRHNPIISSPPEQMIFHFLEKKTRFNEVFEKAVFLLENGNYLYIRYFGPIDNEKVGVTDIEEFKTIAEATEVFDEH